MLVAWMDIYGPEFKKIGEIKSLKQNLKTPDTKTREQ